ncbi:sigma-54-dependent Fis family transcriptional regulator [Acinetobacter sp. P8-3-8]|uniref:sigma-54 interaction domain-containing protein n=1 Tax=Acinetobacter sp. P8-3-8 TaxID=1029823 RepID=UPI0002487FC4|nr:sigma 54-interacting transcriptional regulator [Acinetobacter sp. P8-3-8]
MTIDQVISFMKTHNDRFSLMGADGRSIFDVEPIRSIINAIQDGIYITDADAITIAVNSAYERITGLNRNILIGRFMGDLVELGYLSNSASLEVLKRNEVVTLVQTINGSQNILVTGSPVFDEKNQLICVVTSVRDITELLRAKHAQEQLENLFRSQSQYKVSFSSQALIVSRETQQIFDLVTNVAKFNSKVLLRGETGTGKSKLASYLHSISPRAEHAFLELNCSGMPDNLLEMELFGYVPGAFTGASAKGKKGLLEIAHQGTLFLDEIGDLPLNMQVKLLKVIEDNRFLPVGGTEFKEVDIRIISATHRDLDEMVAQGEFREDLYYRINVIDIVLPPLRERRTEILPLIEQYQRNFNEKYQLEKSLSPEVIESLAQYDWPGNIRQLINVVERLMVSTPQSEISLKDLPEYLRAHSVESNHGLNLKDRVLAFEKDLIISALNIHGSTRATAEALGVEQSTLVKKIARFKS